MNSSKSSKSFTPFCKLLTWSQVDIYIDFYFLTSVLCSLTRLLKVWVKILYYNTNTTFQGGFSWVCELKKCRENSSQVHNDMRNLDTRGSVYILGILAAEGAGLVTSTVRR